jgi:hypothetical protein
MVKKKSTPELHSAVALFIFKLHYKKTINKPTTKLGERRLTTSIL